MSEAGLLLQLRQADEAHGAQPVVDGHTDHALFRPNGTVKMLFMSAAAGIAAAVDINNDGPQLLNRRPRQLQRRWKNAKNVI